MAEALPADAVAGELPPLVLLVHGLSGIWWTMRAPMLALAEAGFHAVAVDLRGHGDSDKPPRGYDAWTLASDITNLVRALGHSSAVIVGQGEGGFYAWTAAYRRPRAVRGLVVVGSPHPLATRRAALRDRHQRRALVPRLVADQAPRLPERRLTRDGAADVEEMLRRRSGPAWPETDDFRETAELLRRAMLIPKVAHLSLESRRWMVRSQFRPDGRDFRRAVSGVLSQPVLGISGAEDRFILPETVRSSSAWAPDFSSELVPGAGHYPVMEAPAETSRLIVDFARRATPS
ncbi:alpha/beta hydrolase [Dietzia cinnamea]|uniref:Pimeloyl-ACP methyl ester carboxylesterase n=1 Tax=Dietzia cinnamea TaxID=321318 RepID=A0A4R3ZTD9_9ACTN|nr:alpha/beta hydrolase [Dietzia cinnamea]TCW23603.1 pimeloyl-ACP methyl ester carboxylesterase [Dietzia cinnamea]